MKILLAILLLFSFSCFASTDKVISVHYVQYNDLNKICTAKFGPLKDGLKYAGCAEWTAKTCDIYVPPYNFDYRRIYWHEMRHCFEGYFHPPHTKNGFKWNTD